MPATFKTSTGYSVKMALMASKPAIPIRLAAYICSRPSKHSPNGQSVTILGVIMDTSATLQQTLDEAVPLLTSG